MSDKKFKLNLTQKINIKNMDEGESLYIKGQPTEFELIDGILHLYNIEDCSKVTKSFKHTPGIKKILSTGGGVKLLDVNLRIENILESITNTQTIRTEIKTFFNRLDVYKKLDQPVRRSMLLYSTPGCGKTVTINKVCDELIAEDPNTLVVIWDTTNIAAALMSNVIGDDSDMSKISRVIIIAEDIGGGSAESYNGPKTTTADLLEFLSGTTNKFKKPTFIICTTNHPENLIKSLSDRPGRIDVLKELLPPNAKERVELVKFIAKRDLTDAEKKVIIEKCEDFTIAYLTEVVVRSELMGTSFAETIQELKTHKERIKVEFTKAMAKIGLGS